MKIIKNVILPFLVMLPFLSNAQTVAPAQTRVIDKKSRSTLTTIPNNCKVDPSRNAILIGGPIAYSPDTWTKNAAGTKAKVAAEFEFIEVSTGLTKVGNLSLRLNDCFGLCGGTPNTKDVVLQGKSNIRIVKCLDSKVLLP